jgi:hypothetical protein
MEEKMNLCTKMIREINRDISDSMRYATKDTIDASCYLTNAIGWKCLYPILGNLSQNTQHKIEDIVEKISGEKYYNAINAYCTSLITNFIAYPILGGAAFDVYGVLLGVTYAMAETITRLDKQLQRDEIIPNLPGAVLSEPIDYTLFVYDRVKGYLRDVKRRVQSEENALELFHKNSSQYKRRSK